MFKRSLIWQLFFAYLLITVGFLVLLTFYNTHLLKSYYIDQLAETLEARAQYGLHSIKTEFGANNQSEINRILKELSGQTQTRFTLILPSGQVIADTVEDPKRLDNHSRRPEIKAALTGKTGRAIRYSETLKTEEFYLAIPLLGNSQPTAVIRTAVPTSDINTRLNKAYISIVTVVAIISIIMVLMSLLATRKITRPLEIIRARVEKYAEGDLTQRLDTEGAEEYHALATAMNQMAAQLNERIQTILRQRNEQEAMLSSMVEGVIALDEEGIIINCNQACAAMFGVDSVGVKGRAIHEVVNKVEVLQFVDRVLGCREPVEKEIELRDRDTHYLIAHGTALYNTERKKIGALLVFYDITKIRHLENVRKDFVANVSHELRTPITSIKGFVETLLDGALDNRPDAERFLRIILKQSDRLNSIIVDLLSLSSLEKGYEQNTIPLSMRDVQPVVASAIGLCENKAAEKNIRIQFDCPEQVPANINANLLEQAVSNLIDNAVKYSPANTMVRVSVQVMEREVVIHVSDEGVGIEAKHLPRIFERFYRVDKGRSRELGGTGLGLAIVKHIALAHKGTATVESIVGKGSVFSLTVPR